MKFILLSSISALDNKIQTLYSKLLFMFFLKLMELSKALQVTTL